MERKLFINRYTRAAALLMGAVSLVSCGSDSDNHEIGVVGGEDDRMRVSYIEETSVMRVTYDHNQGALGIDDWRMGWRVTSYCEGTQRVDISSRGGISRTAGDPFCEDGAISRAEAGTVLTEGR